LGGGWTCLRPGPGLRLSGNGAKEAVTCKARAEKVLSPAPVVVGGGGEDD